MSNYIDICRTAGTGSIDDVKYFVEEKGVGVNTKMPIRGNDTPLHAASNYGNIEVVKYLVSKGANLNLKMNDGCTPLHSAIIPTRNRENISKKNIINMLFIEGFLIKGVYNEKKFINGFFMHSYVYKCFRTKYK